VKIPFGIKRYVQESERLFSVLEDGLRANGDYLVHNKCSVADINAWSWVSCYWDVGIDITQFPLVEAWIDRMAKRQGVKKGLEVPIQREPLDPVKQATIKKAVDEAIALANKE
jgi:glutathione S-transferase